MAKPHKFAGNGVDVETSLSIEQIANMSQRAAQESTGDLLKGKQRIVSTRSADRQIEFRINDYLISFNKLMVFFLDFEERGGRTFASTRIEWYLTTQQTVAGFVPVSPKKMVAHHTYMQFARNLADQVRAADTSAKVTLREGTELGAPPSNAVLPSASGPAAPARTLPPPPPPPPSPVGSFPDPGASSMSEAAFVPAAPLAPSRVPAAPSHLPQGAHGSMPVETALGALAPPRIRPTEQAAPAAGLGVNLVTSVPGFSRPGVPAEELPHLAPSVSVSPPVASESPVVPEAVDAGDDLEMTRRASLHAPLAWQLVLPNSAPVTLDAPCVTGRNPVAPPLMPGAVLLCLADDTQSVSKTHAALEVRNRLVWVTDLHSTNGTTLVNPAGERSECPPGQPVPAGDGWQVLFGDFAALLRGS